jgi:hypothetical protein
MKQLTLILLVAVMGVCANAIEFTVAPLYYIDESTEQVFARNDIQERLLRELNSAATGTDLRFRGAASSQHYPPQSVADAIALSRAEQADYLIYGYISQRAQTVQGELRLLDYGRREIVESFYAMDGRDREDELIKDLAGKLLRYVRETYNIAIEAEPSAFTHIQIPASVGYWQPVDRNWIRLMHGIVHAETGIQIIPSDNVFVIFGYAHYFSIGVGLSYRLGLGSQYPAIDHGITASVPIRLHRILNAQHEIYFGLGFMYFVDILLINKPYEDEATEVYSTAGLSAGGGWAFRLGERVHLFAELQTEFRFYDRLMISLAPRAGVNIRVFTREVAKR